MKSNEMNTCVFFSFFVLLLLNNNKIFLQAPDFLHFFENKYLSNSSLNLIKGLDYGLVNKLVYNKQPINNEKKNQEKKNQEKKIKIQMTSLQILILKIFIQFL